MTLARLDGVLIVLVTIPNKVVIEDLTLAHDAASVFDPVDGSAVIVKSLTCVSAVCPDTTVTSTLLITCKAIFLASLNAYTDSVSSPTKCCNAPPFT